MNVCDPIADAITRLRNALKSRHSLVVLPKSRMTFDVVRILKEEGYIEDFITKKQNGRDEIHIALKYDSAGEPVITKIERVSKPGRRVYRGKEKLPVVLGGLGIALVSTSRGVMGSRKAAQVGLGGEVLCQVY